MGPVLKIDKRLSPLLNASSMTQRDPSLQYVMSERVCVRRFAHRPVSMVAPPVGCCCTRS